MIKLLRTSTFRLAILYLGLFAVSGLAVLSLIYWNTVVYADQQAGETIDAEITGLDEQYKERGLTGLINVIQERSDPGQSGNMLYLLTDGNLRPMAGNLDRWPNATIDRNGWMRFTLTAPPWKGYHPHKAQAASFPLAGNYQLLVGRDLDERTEFTRRIVNALSWSAGLTLMLGLAGGLLMSRWVLARLEAINRASDQVIAGKLDQRIPVRGNGDEFDLLAQNLNAMLDRIERLMGGMRQVSDNIAHDLRSPLGRLRTRLEMGLREESESAEPYRERMQEAIHDADKLLATFSALLEIAEAEAGSLRADKIPLDLGLLVQELADFFEPVAEEANLGLKLEIPDHPIVFSGNRHLLSRAIANLVENALKYTEAPGVVTLTVEEHPSVLRIIISDNGLGIAAESRDHVFDRFVRLDQSRTTPGNGLGLSLARAIVHMHLGEISLHDNDPGLRAVVTLPRAE